ncbi:MAG TPA: hypothetical protein VF764_12745 [Steroidobacteraceae bacterium]
MLALISACGASVAFADPPAAQEATPAAAAPVASATSAPAAAPAKAAPAKESDAALEKRLTNSGYKARMRNGTKVWCKRQEELGSHLGGQEICGTPEELRMVVQQNQDAAKSLQKLYDAQSK